MHILEYTPPFLKNDTSKKEVVGGSGNIYIQRYHGSNNHKLISKILPDMVYNYKVYEGDKVVCRTEQTTIMFRVRHRIIDEINNEEYSLKDKSTNKFNQKADIYNKDEETAFTIEHNFKQRCLVLFDQSKQKVAESRRIQAMSRDLEITIYSNQYNEKLMLAILNAYDSVY